jgi:hypothetical protein
VAGATLFNLEASSDPSRRPFVLLPTTKPLAPLICCGTNANLRGDTNFVVEALMKIAADDPFDVYGCGLDFADAQLRDQPNDAAALAARLIDLRLNSPTSAKGQVASEGSPARSPRPAASASGGIDRRPTSFRYPSLEVTRKKAIKSIVCRSISWSRGGRYGA